MTQPASAFMNDFEVWKELAQGNPEEFEAKRLEAIEAFFDQIPLDKQLQLRRIQWRIDRVRERAGTPLAACVELSRMMWDSFSELRECYQDMFETGRGRHSRPVPVTAKVLAFRQPQLEIAEA